MLQEQPPPSEGVTLENSEPFSPGVTLENSEPFSPAIMKLAQNFELGEPHEEYLASSPLDPDGRAIGLTIVVWLLALLMSLLYVHNFYPWIIIWSLVALGLTLLIWTITFLLQDRRKKTQYQRVYVCASGLLCQRLNAIDAVHWHHIETVSYDTVGNCLVYRNDGVVFSFLYPLQRLGELSGHIEQAIIPHQLSQLLTSYRAGLPIVFGPLRLNQQGIGLTQRNVTLFAWDQIQRIERRFDNLVVKLSNDRALDLPLTAHEIPSVNLAQALIRAILEPAEQVTQELQDPGRSAIQKGRRVQRTQKSQGLVAGSGASSDRTANGSLTATMGDPIAAGTSDKLSVVVYEQGFLYLNKVDNKLDIVRWEQVSQVIRRARSRYRLVEYSIEVTRNEDETVFVFPRSQPLIAGIGFYVEQRAAEWACPALLKQYAANERTAFGKLTVDQAGITYKKRSLPWSEVYQIRILQPNSAHITIKERGSNREWQSIAINKIPDVYLLKLLIDYVISTHQAVQR